MMPIWARTGPTTSPICGSQRNALSYGRVGVAWTARIAGTHATVMPIPASSRMLPQIGRDARGTCGRRAPRRARNTSVLPAARAGKRADPMPMTIANTTIAAVIHGLTTNDQKVVRLPSSSTRSVIAAPAIPSPVPTRAPMVPSTSPCSTTIRRRSRGVAPTLAMVASARCCLRAPTANAAPASRTTWYPRNAAAMPPMMSIAPSVLQMFTRGWSRLVPVMGGSSATVRDSATIPSGFSRWICGHVRARSGRYQAVVPCISSGSTASAGSARVVTRSAWSTTSSKPVTRSVRVGSTR